MADSDYGKELASLDFKNLIGGPLSAVVEAQAMAAESTVNFIKNMGFDQEGNPQYVTFKYQKSATQAEGEAKQSDQNEMMEMQVPFLTLIPIPFIRVDEATIDFNAKINAVNYSTKTSDHKFDAGSDRRKGFIGRLLGIRLRTRIRAPQTRGIGWNVLLPWLSVCALCKMKCLVVWRKFLAYWSRRFATIWLQDKLPG